jgi:hypothetical protein
MLEANAETGLLSPGTVISEIEALLDQRVDIGRPTFARPLA